MPRVFRFALAYVALVFAAGFALGVLRTLWLAPVLGAAGAVLLELPLMIGVSALCARRLMRRWPLSPASALAAGALAFGLLLLAEVGVSLLAGRDLVEHLALYAGAEAQLGLAGQTVFALLPAWLAARNAPENRI